jgi:hypothetical protein
MFIVYLDISKSVLMKGGGVRTNDLGLTKFIVFRSTTLGCKDIGIRKS